MPRIGNELRVQVRQRAGRRCKYCRLPDRLHIGGFEVDHIIPVSRGGQAMLENLAYACPHCNDRKWTHTDAPDPTTGDVMPLFHPRKDRWEDHFRWSTEIACQLQGVTPTGRATIARLQLNHPELVAIRRELLKLGILVVSHNESSA